MATVRIFEADQDLDDVYALWQAVLPGWIVSRRVFRQIISDHTRYQPGDHLIAEEHGRIIGFIATQTDRNGPSAPGDGHILLLMVAPNAQRQGHGAMLHAAALDRFRRNRVHKVQLGGGGPRFWPGVPSNLQGGVDFFAAHGWIWDHTVVDMIRDVRAFITPAPIHERAERQGLSFDILSEPEVPELLAFETREFPQWADAFREAVDLGNTRDVLVARTANRQSAGALLLYTAESHSDRTDVIWKQALGDDAGALGAVGVAEAAREMGIGTALVARGAEILRERGVRTCFLGWVWAIDFYRRLGYDVWQSYSMSSRAIV